MNVICPHCSTRLNLPDDRIPKDRDASFKCPKCKGTVQVKASAQDPADPGREDVRPEGAPSQVSPTPPDDPEFERGRRSLRERALVCMGPSAARDLLAESIRRLDFSIDFPKSPAAALEKLEYQIYPLMVLEDGFDVSHNMMVHMNDMDMLLRRRICLVRVARGVETGNAMAALHSSVNFILRHGDLENEDDLYIEDMLNDALEHHKKMYAVYNDSMKAAGKA